MKFLSTFTILATAFSTAQAGQNPDCKVSSVDDYYNCKTHFFVQGSGSDALWCVSESDCLKVFPAPTPLPTPEPTVAPVAISSVEEALSSSSTMATFGAASALAVAATATLF